MNRPSGGAEASDHSWLHSAAGRQSFALGKPPPLRTFIDGHSDVRTGDGRKGKDVERRFELRLTELGFNKLPAPHRGRITAPIHYPAYPNFYGECTVHGRKVASTASPRSGHARSKPDRRYATMPAANRRWPIGVASVPRRGCHGFGLRLTPGSFGIIATLLFLCTVTAAHPPQAELADWFHSLKEPGTAAADASFFTLSKRKGLPHLSGSRRLRSSRFRTTTSYCGRGSREAGS
jgi:hypothetical protein